MNLIIISLATIGVFTVAYSIVYALVSDNDTAWWVRVLMLLILFGGYAGVVALTMLLLGIPLS